jgi:hypothetical protein
VVVTADDVHRSEGRSVLLLVGLLALVFIAVPLWIRYGGSKAGPLPYIPDSPTATLGGGQKITFAAGDLAAGDSLLCQSQGVLVGAFVPKPGHTTSASFVGTGHTTTIQIRVRDDGVVIARCS